MGTDDTELRRRIQEAVIACLSGTGDCTTTMLVDKLFVQLKPLVMEEKSAYTLSQLREMLTGLL